MSSMPLRLGAFAVAFRKATAIRIFRFHMEIPMINNGSLVEAATNE
jgi:hypothetical protein